MQGYQLTTIQPKGDPQRSRSVKGALTDYAGNTYSKRELGNPGLPALGKRNYLERRLCKTTETDIAQNPAKTVPARIGASVLASAEM
jgi:hypothetical protein